MGVIDIASWAEQSTAVDIHNVTDYCFVTSFTPVHQISRPLVVGLRA